MRKPRGTLQAHSHLHELCLLGQLHQSFPSRVQKLVWSTLKEIFIEIFKFLPQITTSLGSWRMLLSGPRSFILLFIFSFSSLSSWYCLRQCSLHERLMRDRLKRRQEGYDVYVLYTCSSLFPSVSVQRSFGSVCSLWRVINYFSCHYRGNLTEWRSALFLCCSTCGQNTRENTRREHTRRHTKTPLY